MTETLDPQEHLPLPFLLKATAFFLAADGIFKLAAILSNVVPGPEIFGYDQSRYYYGLVAVVDLSLAVQILGRVHYAWILGLAFFTLRSVVLLTHFIFTSPLSWLGPGKLGRIQVVISIALYVFLARYIVSRPVRKALSPQSGQTGTGGEHGALH